MTEASAGQGSPEKAKTLRDMLAENPNYDEEKGDKQVEFENIIQQVCVHYPKLYLWNENAIKVFRIEVTMDLNELIKQDQARLGHNIGQSLNLLDSFTISRELTGLERYKQIRNLDFTNY